MLKDALAYSLTRSKICLESLVPPVLLQVRWTHILIFFVTAGAWM